MRLASFSFQMSYCARNCAHLCPMILLTPHGGELEILVADDVYRPKTDRVWWPLIIMATLSGIPAFTMSLMAVLLKSWNMRLLRAYA